MSFSVIITILSLEFSSWSSDNTLDIRTILSLGKFRVIAAFIAFLESIIGRLRHSSLILYEIIADYSVIRVERGLHRVGVLAMLRIHMLGLDHIGVGLRGLEWHSHHTSSGEGRSHHHWVHHGVYHWVHHWIDSWLALLIRVVHHHIHHLLLLHHHRIIHQWW